MTHKHTQGPWIYTTDEDWDGAHIMDKHGRIVADCQGCDIPGACGEVGTDEAKANARLISAAPDLLEALEMLMPFAPNHFTECQYTKAVWQDAAKAIAKARGQA
jgi:hypothetical protein